MVTHATLWKDFLYKRLIKEKLVAHTIDIFTLTGLQYTKMNILGKNVRHIT